MADENAEHDANVTWGESKNKDGWKTMGATPSNEFISHVKNDVSGNVDGSMDGLNVTR